MIIESIRNKAITKISIILIILSFLFVSIFECIIPILAQIEGYDSSFYNETHNETFNETLNLSETINETRQDNIGLLKNWFIKNTEEFEDGDEINWMYSPLITDNFSNSTSLLINVTQLAAEESFISSRVIEVTPNTTYKVSFFIKNTTFADETKEFADIIIYEFDDNQNPTCLSGAILRFNSTYLLKVTEPFDVVEENIKNLGRKVTVLFPTTIDGRYEKFILSYVYSSGDAYYVIDDFRIEKLTEGKV